MKLLLVLLAGIYTVTGLRGRIAGGELASPGQFPYVVSITENDRHICGGFIYSSRWIVTVASCVAGKSMLELNVVAGQLNLLNPDINEQIMDVYTITPFPEYNSTNKRNDIALIRLKAEILFDYVHVDFVAFNEADTTDPVAVVMGWGATFDGGFESLSLRYAGVFIQPSDSATPCDTSVNLEFDFSIMICGSISAVVPPEGSPCQYDEGSPLVQQITYPGNSTVAIPSAVGIFSKTQGCQISNIGVYTRLSAYSTWLLSTAGQQPTRYQGNPYL